MKEVRDCLWDAFDVWNMSKERISNNKNGMFIPRNSGPEEGSDSDQWIGLRKGGFVSGSLTYKTDR